MAARCENCTDLKPELGRFDCKAIIPRLEIAQMIRLGLTRGVAKEGRWRASEWGWGEGVGSINVSLF